MAERNVYGIKSALFLVCLLTLASSIRQVNAYPTIYIRADGSVYPPTPLISSVDNVTYTFTGSIFGYRMVVERDNIVIDGNGHELFNSDYAGKGMDLSERKNVTVQNIHRIWGFYTGVVLNHSSYIRISGNSISYNYYFQIWVDSSFNNTISGNIITNTNSYTNYGIWLNSSADNSIIGNNISNNGFGIELHSSSNNTISGNKMTANYDLYTHMGWAVGLFSSSNNNSINGNNITANYQVANTGVFLNSSSYNGISSNNITRSGNGISLSYSSNNIINGNSITNLGDIGNFIDGNGISLVYSFNNTMNGNNVTKGRIGISLSHSSSNGINGNNVSNHGSPVAPSGGDGISLSYSSAHNNISGNNIAANANFGISFDSSSDNVVYHNNFISNFYQFHSANSMNIWNDRYPSGGNFWSDCTGVDVFTGPYQNVTGSDGIYDIPYIVDSNNKDKYPLTNPWSGLTGDIDGDGDVDHDDLHILSQVYGTRLGGTDYHTRADLDQNGDVAVLDLYMLGKNYGKP